MPKTRLEFQTFLETFKGDRNVYFQPPPSVQMKYPAIKYSLSDIGNIHADNLSYIQRKAYQLIYITKNPDDPMIDSISQLPMCEFDRHYTSDNLNHYSFTIFY